MFSYNPLSYCAVSKYSEEEASLDSAASTGRNDGHVTPDVSHDMAASGFVN